MEQTQQIDIFSMLLPKLKLKPPIRLFEAFAGIGTQAMALKRITDDYELVGFSEIDKYAIKSYLAIHGDVKNYGDITQLRGGQLPQIDIFTWSFPCTDLSKAGKQKGLTNTRSGLGFEVVRVLEECQERGNLPKVLLMENVPDLLCEKFKIGWNEIYRSIENLGYSNYVEILNAKDYGVAQNRQRVFMVSILGEYSYQFPMKQKLTKRLKDYLEDKVADKFYLSEKQIRQIANWDSQRNPVDEAKESDSDMSHTITAKSNTSMNASMLLLKEEPHCLNSKVNGKQPSVQNRVYDKGGISTAITTSFLPNVAIPEATIIDTKSTDKFRRKPSSEISPAILTDTRLSLVIPEATKKGYAEATDGDGVYINRPHQKRGVVQKGLIQTLKTGCGDVGVVVKEKNMKQQMADEYAETGYLKEHDMFTHSYTNSKRRQGVNSSGISDTLDTRCDCKGVVNNLRIRKLTPLECGRLMDVSEDDIEKMLSVVSDSQAYKQYGNAIVVAVLEAIFKELIMT